MAVIEIDTLEKLIAFSNGEYGRGTSSEYLNVMLTTDLDFADMKVDNSPYNWAGCTGTWYINFDGLGHKIDNISFIGIGAWGFFNTVQANSTIKNLKLPNMHVVSTFRVSGLVVHLHQNCNIINCHLSGQLQNIETNNNWQDCGNCVAGFIGQPQSSSAYSYIIGCSFVGRLLVSSSSSHTHGISGHAYNNDGRLMVANCYLDVYTTSGNDFLLPVCYNVSGYVTNCEWRIHGPANGAFGRQVNNIIIPAEPETAGSYNINGDDTLFNVYVDSDAAAEYGYTYGSSILPATTAQLKDKAWLKSKGFAV